RKNVTRFFVSAVDNALHFLVDLYGGVLGIVAVLGDLTAKKDGFVLLAEGQWAKSTHAPFANHVAGDVGGALDVVSGAGSDVAQENFFGGTATHQHCKHSFEVFACVSVLVGLGQLHR